MSHPHCPHCGSQEGVRVEIWLHWDKDREIWVMPDPIFDDMIDAGSLCVECDWGMRNGNRPFTLSGFEYKEESDELD